MDLRESFRVLRRHWFLTLVLLILTLTGAVGVALKLPWKYSASETEVLLNSNASSKVDGQGNPYLSFSSSLVQTANILAIELGSPATAQVLQGQGYTGSYQTQVLSENAETEEPFIQVSVTGKDAATVLQTLHGVTTELHTLLNTLQKKIPAQDRATLQVLSEDSRSTRSSSGKIKPSVGFLGVGMVLTFIIPQALDGVLSRRRKRKVNHANENLRSGARETDTLPGPKQSRPGPGSQHDVSQPRWTNQQAGAQYGHGPIRPEYTAPWTDDHYRG